MLDYYMSKNKFIAYENVFDESTLRGLFKLSSQGYFDNIEGPISTGKESNVFTVLLDGEKRVAKIYRTAANFKKMSEYMKADPRFAGVKGTKLSIIYMWAKKEFRNLHRGKEGGVSSPTPYAVYKNILIMEYFDAPLLLHKAPKKPREFYERLIKEIQKLLKAGLVHSDISEYNVLNYDEKPVIIDFSHALDLRFPNVQRLLSRDVHNVVSYFNRLGLELDEKKEFEKVWTSRK
jgi:RIO kinase 1